MKNHQLLKIAEDFGGPVYIYDAEKIQNQYNKLELAFKSVKNLSINYATKALSNINILKYLNSLGAGLDTVSLQEVQLGLKAGFNPKNIIYTPNGVSIDEIEKVNTFKEELDLSSRAEYKKLMKSYGILSEDPPSLSEYIFYLIFSKKNKKGEERMAHNSLSIGKNIEEKFIKGVFNLIKVYTVQKPKLYYNPKQNKSGKITAEFARNWEDIEGNDTIEPVHVNDFGDGVKVWDSFLATGNNVLRDYLDFKQLVEYIPKPPDQDLRDEKWNFSGNYKTFSTAIDIFLNYFINYESENIGLQIFHRIMK